MALFVLRCRDIANGLSIRMQNRPDHLSYLQEAGARVLLAGPFLNDAGEPVGSMVLIDVEGRAKAAQFADDDPYNEAGLFEGVEIEPYKIVLGALASQ